LEEITIPVTSINLFRQLFSSTVPSSLKDVKIILEPEENITLPEKFFNFCPNIQNITINNNTAKKIKIGAFCF
jgi:hypothetical protein